jgi:hypothetical protein
MWYIYYCISEMIFCCASPHKESVVSIFEDCLYLNVEILEHNLQMKGDKKC